VNQVPSSCKAAALVSHGAPLEIIDVPIPVNLEPGALLVQTLSATVCATDIHRLEGTVASKDARSALPVILGHEVVGRVVRMGSGVVRDSIGLDLAIGDRVIWTHGFCGQCPACVVQHEPVLCERRRGYMAGPCTEYPYLTGGFAEYCYVYPTSGRVKVPNQIDDAIAAASSCSLRTVVHGFERLGAVDDRHAVVIQGSGPLGLFALAISACSGPKNVIVIGGPSSRLDLAKKWGATETIDVALIPDPAERLALILEATGGRGADVVVEVSGVPAAFNEGIAMLRRGGRYLVIGQIHGEAVQFNPSELVLKHIMLIGSLSASVEHYYRGLQFLRYNSSRFDWSEMISNRYPLGDINNALHAMKSHQEIKPEITFGE
jgi:L-iditol 2-dehydrogenase